MNSDTQSANQTGMAFIDRDHSPSSGYRPEQLIQIAPPFRWPPRPVVLFKWLFGFPGYLWPWKAFFVGLALVSWLYLTPDVDKMKSLSVDWVAVLFVRNLMLLVVFVSAWHLRLYVRKAQGSDYKYNSKWPSGESRTFLFRSQLWDNVFWNVCSAVPIWTAYEALTFWLQANGLAPTVSWQAHPVYCVLLAVFIIPIWIEIHFYTTHRLIHWRPLYRSVHYIHHKNINVAPWSGVAMHPMEHLIYFSAAVLLWFIPSHPLHSLFLLQSIALAPAAGRLGFDRMILGKKISLNTDHYMHYLHHKYFNVNYGTNNGLLPLDRWMGTFHDGSDEAQQALKKRVREQALRSRPGGEGAKPDTQNRVSDP